MDYIRTFFIFNITFTISILPFKICDFSFNFLLKQKNRKLSRRGMSLFTNFPPLSVILVCHKQFQDDHKATRSGNAGVVIIHSLSSEFHLLYLSVITPIEHMQLVLVLITFNPPENHPSILKVYIQILYI